MIPWVIIGGGRLGQTLARVAESIGVEVRAIWNRSTPLEAPAEHHVYGDLRDLGPHLGGAIVWVTVVDSAISETASTIADYLKPADVVVHASGSQSSTILREAGVSGPVGSIHPLLSIHDPERAAAAMRECAWTVEGDYAALQFARWFLGEIGIEPYEVKPDTKVLYHAAAVTSAGLITSLMDVAFEMAREAGFDRFEARELLIPLALSTLENLADSQTADALTGPIARGDENVVARHLEALADVSDSAKKVYEVLTERSRGLKE